VTRVPVRHGGWVLVVYETVPSILLFVMFLASIALHASGGAKAYSAGELVHGGQPVTFWEYLGTSQFWFESLQNWQSEFLVSRLCALGDRPRKASGAAWPLSPICRRESCEPLVGPAPMTRQVQRKGLYVREAVASASSPDVDPTTLERPPTS
jgi:hypothetical protein